MADTAEASTAELFGDSGIETFPDDVLEQLAAERYRARFVEETGDGERSARVSSALDGLVTPDLRSSLLEHKRRILAQFKDVQQSGAIIPYALDDHFFSLEEDWLVEKDTVVDRGAMQRWQQTGRELSQARVRGSTLAAGPTALPAPAASAQAGPAPVLTNTVPLEATQPKKTGLSALLQLLKNPNVLVPLLLIAGGTGRVWTALPRLTA